MPRRPNFGPSSSEQRQAEQKAAEREARRPLCTDCGTKFTDKRVELVQELARYEGAETHPQLRGKCKRRAVDANGHRPRPRNNSG